MTGDAGSSITFVNGYASLSLAAGEEAVIQGILDGAYYDVREDDADTDGYVYHLLCDGRSHLRRG